MLAAVTNVGPYAAVMGFGFLIGVFGHVIRSRPLIITGIVLVGAVSAYFAFFVAKIT
jgi:glucan phosphoethanolaminetransferase (alkaline phosphatase superfamily)